MEQTTLLKDVTNNVEHKRDDEEEAQACVEIWRYVFGFTEMALVKCAIDLGIADVLQKNGGSMPLSELASTLKCPSPTLYRVMRFLAHRKIFSQSQTSQGTLVYTQTPLSRRLLSQGENSMAPLIILESNPVMIIPLLGLSNRVQEKDESAFVAAHGEDVWSYAYNNLALSKLFNDAMACDARSLLPRIIKGYPNLLDGVSTFVDVGGGVGTTSAALVEAFPGIQAINFDLPHVLSEGVFHERVQHVGGNMFESVPKADVAFIKWVLHDWGDDECIQILKKCKEAISKDKGKVIILEAVLEEDAKDKLEDARLMLDMVMLAHTTKGKERTFKEWSCLLSKAGFSHFNVKPIQAVQSVIEAYH